MKLLFLFVISLLMMVHVGHANAAVDHKTFVKCWNKLLSPEICNVLNATDEQFLENIVFSGNITAAAQIGNTDIYFCVHNSPK